MADQDWDTIGQELYSLLGSTKESGDLWKAWVHARDTDKDEFDDVAWQCSNQDEMWAYYDDTVNAAEQDYGSFHSTWLTTFEKDKSNITVMKSKAETWDDEVSAKLRRAPKDTGESHVAESWYGPSAQKYATALQEQTAALAEINAMSGQMATGLNDTRMILQGIFLAIKNSSVPIKDKLNGADKSNLLLNQLAVGKIFENIAYGAAQFRVLKEWLSDLASDGDWKDSMQNIQMSFEDVKKDSVPFEKDKWPKATTGNMQDMQNGQQTQPGGPAQTATTGTETPYTPVDTNADGTPVEGAEQTEYQEGKKSNGWGTGVDGETVDPNAEE